MPSNISYFISYYLFLAKLCIVDDEDSDTDVAPSDDMVEVYTRKLESLKEILESVYNKADTKKLLHKLTSMNRCQINVR